MSLKLSKFNSNTHFFILNSVFAHFLHLQGTINKLPLNLNEFTACFCKQPDFQSHMHFCQQGYDLYLTISWWQYIELDEQVDMNNNIIDQHILLSKKLHFSLCNICFDQKLMPHISPNFCCCCCCYKGLQQYLISIHPQVLKHTLPVSLLDSNPVLSSEILVLPTQQQRAFLANLATILAI